MDLRARLQDARVYLIYTDSASVLPLEDALRLAAEGGVDMVQIREKGPRERRLDLARRALAVLQGRDIPVIVNDDPEAAVAARAQGVHLGPLDMDPAAAREILEPGMILGLSSTTIDDALAAERAGADYIGVGTVFPTDTKTGKSIIGPAGAAAAARAVSIPAFPIGGIDAAGAKELARAGLGRAAVCAAILGGRGFLVLMIFFFSRTHNRRYLPTFFDSSCGRLSRPSFL